MFEKGDISGVKAKDAERIRLRLLVIDEVLSTDEFRNSPGFRFHSQRAAGKNCFPSRSGLAGTFEFLDGDAYILNLEDYY